MISKRRGEVFLIETFDKHILNSSDKREILQKSTIVYLNHLVEENSYDVNFLQNENDSKYTDCEIDDQKQIKTMNYDSFSQKESEKKEDENIKTSKKIEKELIDVNKKDKIQNFINSKITQKEFNKGSALLKIPSENIILPKTIEPKRLPMQLENQITPSFVNSKLEDYFMMPTIK